jgi:hypothetical protein
MASAPDSLPNDVEALKAALIETRAKLSGAEALIEHLQLVIAKMKREKFGPRSERSQRLIDQMELQLEELAAAAGEDAARAEAAVVQVPGFPRRQATRRNFPDHLPRRRIVYPAPTACPCCGGSKLSKIGEDVTETLDVVPRQWFRDRACAGEVQLRSCETITQPPAPFHAIARPSLLAGDDAGREVCQPPAAQPAERSLCARGGRALGLDPGGPRRRVRGHADAALRADQGARVRGRADSLR